MIAPAPSSGNGKLLPQHRDDLYRSGLTDQTIEAAHFRSVTDPREISRLLNWSGPSGIGPCLGIPYLDSHGNETGYVRLKPDHPRVNKTDGKPFKYEAPLGSTNRLYIPPGCTRAALQDPAEALSVSEGKKRRSKRIRKVFHVLVCPGSGTGGRAAS
jgi:hypothetical protein